MMQATFRMQRGPSRRPLGWTLEAADGTILARSQGRYVPELALWALMLAPGAHIVEEDAPALRQIDVSGS